MQVKALDTGFFAGARIRPGQVFDVPEGTKGKWFAPIEEYKTAAGKKAEKAAKQPQQQALSELAKGSTPKTQVEVLAESADSIA